MKELNKFKVLVTRPESQADHFIKMIEDSHGIAINLPTIEIAASPLTAEDKALLNDLAQINIVIFVSINAVHYGLKALQSLKLDFPENLIVAAVGPSTAQALHENNVQVDIVPEDDYSSEGLLAMPELEEIAGEKILIFRGQFGRELLSAELTRRYASVESIQCYQRVLPEVDVAPVVKSLKSSSLDAITVTSASSVHNLFELMGKNAKLLTGVPFVVASQRIGEVCESYDVASVHVADDAGDKAMLQALSDLAHHVDVPESADNEELEDL